MSSTLRKLVLTIHLTSSVGWIGSVVAYLALVLYAMSNRDAQTLRAGWQAMQLIGWYVIVPLAIGSLLTGLVISLGTPWGLFRHYWVLLSLVLTAFAVGVLLQHMPTVNFFAELAVKEDTAALNGLSGELFHAGVGFVILMVIQVLNIYKPRGLTAYGWRKQQDRRVVSPS
jgi:hypothetical protein